MITKEVPTARFMRRPRNSVRAGVMRKPPPTPSSPVRNPTSTPTPTALGAQSGRPRLGPARQVPLFRAVRGASVPGVPP